MYILFNINTPGQAILTTGFRFGYRRNPAKSDKIRQDSVEFCADLVGSEGQNPLVRIPVTFERIQPELFEADRIQPGVIDLGPAVEVKSSFLF